MENFNNGLDKTIQTLNFLKLYTPQIEGILRKITKSEKYDEVDYELLERGLRKILLKKGKLN